MNKLLTKILLGFVVASGASLSCWPHAPEHDLGRHRRWRGAGPGLVLLR